ncbi:glycosyl hydrolase [Streptomyces brasiliscabiei]|uniref:glycosyl hydrolase n=1 Tax=Streptomyces brasiliscabiei TaxID=2736302 RepID=UPI001C1051AC|nr:glycosyl hydrolase [Streptomyces brasiliscabiei]
MTPISRRRLCADVAALSVGTPALLSVGGAAAAGTTGSAGSAGSSVTADHPAFPAIARGFASIGESVRPKIRYWWPCGEISAEAVEAEMRQIAGRGFAAAEIQCIFTADPDRFGWGGATLTERLEQAVAAGRRHGLRIDLTVGPAWPLVVPGLGPDSRQAAQELTYGRSVVAGGSTYTGPVPAAPEPHTGVTKQTLVAVQAFRRTGSGGAKPVVLERSSRVDLTDAVHDGVLSWTAPAGGQWLVLGFWQRGTGQAAVVGQSVSAQPAYVPDHFAAAGVRAAMGYWDEHVLTPRLRRLLRDNGGDLFEDSLELDSALHWTWDLPKRFEKLRGYALRPNLPVLFIDGIHRQYTSVTLDATPDFEFTDGSGARVREDYCQTLTDLYISDHVEPLKNWAHALGLRFRAQPYGTTIDTPTVAAALDVNETESLGVGTGYDDDPSRWISSGSVHLSGQKIFSLEGCATFNEAYAQTWPDMLKHFNTAFAHGVNQIVYHGFATGTGMGVTGWPGFSPFTTEGGNGFSEAWGPRQPTWADTHLVTDWTARMQWVLRQGRPSVDLAVYRHSYGPDVRVPDGAAGFTYDFTGPAQLEGTRVGGGRLAPDGPAYRALILDRQPTLPVATARLLLSHARAGLPVVVVGNLPTRTPGAHAAEEQTARLTRLLGQLLDQPSVRRVADQRDLAGALKALGVAPSVDVRAAPGLLTVRRTLPTGELYYVYNPTSSSVTADIRVEGTGRPYELDAWSGKVTPLGLYRTGRGHITLPVDLAPAGSTVIALDGRRVRHATATTGGTVTVSDSGRLRLRATASGRYTVTLDDGRKRHVVIPSPGEEQRLDSWHLTVEDWRRGPDGERATTVHELDLDQLSPWSDIPGLRDVSGIGTYTTTVRLGRPDGAWLDLGRVTDTFQVTVNGRRLPPPDQISHRLDLAGHLREGANTITVRVATPLRNRLRVTDGFPGQAGMPRQEYGLIGPVSLVPYREAPILDTTTGAVAG